MSGKKSRDKDKQVDAYILTCWHCDSDDVSLMPDGWLCHGCGQYGDLGTADCIEEGCRNNIPYIKRVIYE